MSARPYPKRVGLIKTGQYKGAAIQRVPVWYLENMIQTDHPQKDIAETELSRRGTKHSEIITVSNHAIDRASQDLLKHWKKTRVGDEGLYTWLARIATDAFIHGATKGIERGTPISKDGIEFRFGLQAERPVLATVARSNK